MSVFSCRLVNNYLATGFWRTLRGYGALFVHGLLKRMNVIHHLSPHCRAGIDMNV